MAGSDCTRVALRAMHLFDASPTAALPPLPPAAVVLIAGLIFLTGFAAGVTAELANLRARERKLARGQRLLAAQMRGLR